MNQMISQAQALKPAFVPRDEGDARWWLGSLAVIKAATTDTGGQFSLVEVTEPPNAEGPLHVHHREDEGFLMLEGDAIFQIGDTTIEAHTGDYVFGPRDIPHRYSVGSAGCRILLILTPGGFENLIIEMSVPAGSRTLPPPQEEEPDWDRVATIAQANGCELLG